MFYLRLVVVFFICFELNSVVSELNETQTPSYSDEDSEEDYVFCTKETYNKTCCIRHEFQCDNGACVPGNKVCDLSEVPFRGMVTKWRVILNPSMASDFQCSDWSDELSCERNKCKNRENKCPQNCMDIQDNKSRCTCYKGYAIQMESSGANSSLSCVDINECDLGLHWCDHDCINLNGTFQCACRDGFKMNDSMQRGSCKADDRNILILYNSENTIYGYDLETREQKKLITTDNVSALDYDITNEMIYWSSKEGYSRSYIPGVNDSINATIGYPQLLPLRLFHDDSMRNSLSIDWIAGNMYFLVPNLLNLNKSDIMVSKLDGRYPMTVIKGIKFATSLVVDPEQGRMYWAAGGDDSRIEEGWMNGYLHIKLLKLKGQHPVALALDHKSNGRIFWVDSITNNIYSSFTDGTRHFHVITPPPHRSPISMDVFETYIYWVTKESNELVRVDKFGRSRIEVLASNIKNPTSLKIYHKQKMEKEIRKNVKHQIYCKDQCTHLCLHIPGSYICKCPNDIGFVRFQGEAVCPVTVETPYPDPLICDCTNTEQLCNESLPYSKCPCDKLCEKKPLIGNEDIHEKLSDGNSIAEKEHISPTILTLIIFVITTTVVLILCIMSYYKRN